MSVARWHGDAKHTTRHSGMSVRLMNATGGRIYAEVEMSVEAFGEFVGGMGHLATGHLEFANVPRRCVRTNRRKRSAR